MSTIILRGADFSANNIGKVEISLPFDVLTISALERNGVTVDETNSFQKALNSFFISLRNAGLVGDANAKIKALCLPFLSAIAQSGNTAYAQLNVLNGSNFFTNDILGSLTLTDKGLKAVDGADAKSINLTEYTTYDDLHLAAYNITNEPIETTDTSYFSKFITGSCTRILGLMKNRGATYGPHVYVNSSYQLLGDSNYSVIPTLEIVNLSSIITFFVNGQKTENLTPPYVNSSLSNPKFLVYTKSTYTDVPTDMTSGYAKASYSLISLGKAMTDEQSITYNDAVNTLMIAVNAYL